MSNYKIFNSYADQKTDALKFRGLPLYRFFKEPEHAQALLDGEVWISTLKKCREFECPQQGDKHEGTATYHQLHLSIDNRIITEDDHLTLRHLRIDMGLPPPGEFYNGSIHLSNNVMTKHLPNGFLLCTTNAPVNLQEQSSEWRYGVEINLRQSKIFELLNKAIARKNIHIVSRHHAWADYDTSRTYHDPRKAPQHLAFIKPDLHRPQSEYRFFWEALNGYNYPDDGILIDCPEIKPYLKKL